MPALTSAALWRVGVALLTMATAGQPAVDVGPIISEKISYYEDRIWLGVRLFDQLKYWLDASDRSSGSNSTAGNRKNIPKRLVTFNFQSIYGSRVTSDLVSYDI